MKDVNLSDKLMDLYGASLDRELVSLGYHDGECMAFSETDGKQTRSMGTTVEVKAQGIVGNQSKA